MESKIYGGLGKLWGLATEDKGKVSGPSDNILLFCCIIWRHGFGRQLHGPISFVVL